MVYIDNQQVLSAEERRLREDSAREKYWKKWGPYTAERQWATVREDYSCVHRPICSAAKLPLM